MLTVDKVNIQLGSLTLARDMSFGLQPGQITAILGPNGTGKSTLLKTLFGEIKLSSGEIRYSGNLLSYKSLAQWRNKFGYMPQDINLDVNLTVIEVILLGRLDALSLRVDDRTLNQALHILDNIGISHLANRSVNTLSGGQCQMVLFAQALMRDPAIMMLDEPVSALDLHHQHVLLEHLVSQTREKQCITLMVLHDLNLAAQYADNLLVLKQGELVASGHPKQILTSELVQDIYNVEAQVITDDSGVPFVRTLRSIKAA
ncbi:ATP-binding cassette domain-containing protein [Photobacterium halotolerans]|uniref:ABC transporter ATP-binding protein n=1 Tax=Photobacterium halotolerans TaxID=265726 RepID=UPI0013730583|nr:ABC transporter ATP-binding protein [Photobacterium halotolerans]NAX45548.1 ATP-binding cassette domain-containing protein [Photobacterium halotolerans]